MIRIRNYGPVMVYKMGRSIGPFVPYYTHAFSIGDTLIDSGTLFAADEFLQSLGNRSVSTVINTHYHEDHIGNNRVLQKKYSARILAHRDSIRWIERPHEVKLRLYQKLVWGVPESSIAEKIGNSIAVDNYTFEVIHTEGHSPGHICLHEPDMGWLFSGDMFCGIRNIVLRKDEDFNLTFTSLQKLAALNIRTIFCSLKGVIENGASALDAKIQFMKELREKALELLRSGESPANITARLLGREDPMYYLTAGHFSKRNVINSIMRFIN